MLERVVKIMFVTFLALYTLYKREHVMWLMWIIVVSIGFYGVKGGASAPSRVAFQIVWGPPLSFIADNNAVSTCNHHDDPAAGLLLHHVDKALDTCSDRWVDPALRRVRRG